MTTISADAIDVFTIWNRRLIRNFLLWLLALLLEWLLGKTTDKESSSEDGAECDAPWASEWMFRSDAGAY